MSAHPRIAGIHHESTGGSGCPLVLAGGGSAMDLRQWEEVVAGLPARYRAVTYDPRGVGHSAAPDGPYDDREDLLSLLDALGLERAILIGASSAGGLVLDFATRHPERVAGVVAVAPFLSGWTFSGPMQERVDGFAVAMEAGPEAFVEAALADPHFIPAPDRPAVRNRAREVMLANLRREDVDPSFAARPEVPLIDRISGIRVPVLLLVGELDHPDLHRRIDFLVNAIEDAGSIRIPRVGHTLQMEDPAAFLRAVGPFLERTCARSAHP